MMEDDSKPVLPFGKLSVTKRDAMGDTSNKTAPQYGTEDANTLQAAMSGKITLGDAVLTGRDDKTNINAGFYYTELRLAKVWQNIFPMQRKPPRLRSTLRWPPPRARMNWKRALCIP